MPKVQGTCEVCGKSIEFFPSQKRRFCSNSCAGYKKGKELVARGLFAMQPQIRTGKTLECVECGASFYARANELKKNRRYCSHACSAQKDKKPRTIKPCAYCGKSMSLKPSTVNKKYCSNDCNALGMTKDLRPEMYNGKPIKMKHGYIFVWEPTNPDKSWQGWQPLHRLVAEKKIGRFLQRGEQVHHINGVKDDNREENLQVMRHLDHLAITSREHNERMRRELAELAEYRKRFGALT